MKKYWKLFYNFLGFWWRIENWFDDENHTAKEVKILSWFAWDIFKFPTKIHGSVRTQQRNITNT